MKNEVIRFSNWEGQANQNTKANDAKEAKGSEMKRISIEWRLITKYRSQLNEQGKHFHWFRKKIKIVRGRAKKKKEKNSQIIFELQKIKIT